MDGSRLWRRVRRVWVGLGLGFTVVFAGWSLVAYRASADARQALRSDARVRVAQAPGSLGFLPIGRREPAGAGLLFFPGALVDPAAYAPLARAAAEAGFPAYVVKLPRRGAFGGADDPGVAARADSIMHAPDGPVRWVLAGHSRGGVVASRLAAGQPARMAGLVLIGTSHPRDVSLRGLRVPVTKIVGTRDGLASPAEVRANAGQLPPSTRWLWIEGGNHSQFGWYGFQPGDRRAPITREAQQAAMIGAVLADLRRAAHPPPHPGLP